MKAIAEKQEKNLLFAVLTLNQRRDIWDEGKTAKDSYGMLYGKFKALKQILNRTFGVEGYCAVLEKHRSGTVHVNVVIQSEALAAHARAMAENEAEPTIKPLWWRRLVKRAGFGTQSSIEPVRLGERGNLAAYVTKICESQTRLLNGEVTKFRQAPGVHAPLGTRLVRPSRNWWTKELKSELEGQFTGKIQRLSYEEGLLADAYEAPDVGECEEEQVHTEGAAASAVHEVNEPEKVPAEVLPFPQKPAAKGTPPASKSPESPWIVVKNNSIMGKVLNLPVPASKAAFQRLFDRQSDVVRVPIG